MRTITIKKRERKSINDAGALDHVLKYCTPKYKMKLLARLGKRVTKVKNKYIVAQATKR